MISIPNPCSEDFDKMTPTEKGAYCKVCSTDTYDFRKLTDNQIYQIMDENKGKHICGRFTKGQIESLNAPAFFTWKNQTRRTFQSKFLLACVLVFGLTLFSCEDKENGIIDDINVEQVLSSVESNIGFINSTDEPEIVTADLLDYVVDEQDIQCDLIMETAGEIMVDYDQPVQRDHVYDVLGGVVVSTDYDYIIEPLPVEDTTETTTLSNPIEIDQRAFEATAYPNPTQGMTTVAIDVENEGQYEIMMFNMSGQMVTSIHSGHLYTGRQTFEVDMFDFNSGMYIVKVLSQGQEETLKVQKVN